MGAFALDPKQVRDISPFMLDARGRLRVVPPSTLASTTPDERLLFGVRHGAYSFPTEELCDYLRERIAGRRAIEISAGNGVLAEALGIPATDNRSMVISSTAIMPARAPALIAMFHMVMRLSMDVALMAAPENSSV